MLRGLHKQMAEEHEGKLERRRSKRQRLLHFFRSWRQKPQDHHGAPTPTAVEKTTPQQPPNESSTVDIPSLEQSRGSIDKARASSIEAVEESPPQPQLKEEEVVTTLSEEQVCILFAGAPHFHISNAGHRPVPTASYPWDNEGTAKNVSDSLHPVEPAFTATTLCKYPPSAQKPLENEKRYKGYEPDIIEMPSMIGAQGIEPGTVGFSYFLELPMSDSLVTDPEQSQSGIDSLEAKRNKELMQANPERLGIRPVKLDLIYDRLVEFQDLYEAFQDTPEPMTILNNQSSGDLYANLFSKFLTPPGYDNSTDDPTGLQTQIIALLKILRLKGVWYDFSLVEWRIRLGQILWSDSEPIPEHESHSLLKEREVLLLQITLACELLLRLDTFTNVDASDAEVRLQIDPKDVDWFLKTKTRKIDWDLVLARRFLENISIVRGSDAEDLSTQPKSRGLLSLLRGSAQAELPRSDIILLPQHQTRQLSGLLHFAETIRWPNVDFVLKDLAHKLGVHERTEETMQQLSPSGRSFDPTTPSCISVYGTPLQTPLPANHVPDSYFGHVGKPVLNRNNSRSLRIPLSPTWSSSEDRSEPTLDNVGGWLSRSFLTGLVLPGEAISHFLISTLLENDKAAITNLGDNANLYGGFTYAERTWWSKNSIVGRVLACVEGSTECMGWISCTKPPEGLDGWHSIYSEPLPYENRLSTTHADSVARDSAIVPGDSLASVKSEDLVLPSDLESAPTPSFAFTQWELTPINPDLIDNDELAGPPTEDDIHAPSITFTSHDQTVNHTFTLAYDVQFITSWPCTPLASAPAPATSLPHILKRSLTESLSRSSSKRSETLSRRNSHGFEPLLSHPPNSTDIAPKRMYDVNPEDGLDPFFVKSKPMNAHPLHKSYLHTIVPVTDVLDPDFQLPFAMHTSKSTERLLSLSHPKDSEEDTIVNNRKTVLVLDARASSDLDLLARAWCAEKGLHAIIGRASRTCLACCIREARGLGINIVIRV